MKRAGIDGIQYEALQNLNEENQQDLLNAVNTHITQRTLAPEWSQTILKTIPKGGDDRNPNDLRPLGLQSTIFMFARMSSPK